MSEEKGKVLKTILKKEVFNKLTSFAKNYATGINKWDYGVAIQILLEHYESNNGISQVNNKLDELLSILEQPDQFKGTDEVKEEKCIELLGGQKIIIDED